MRPQLPQGLVYMLRARPRVGFSHVLALPGPLCSEICFLCTDISPLFVPIFESIICLVLALSDILWPDIVFPLCRYLSLCFKSVYLSCLYVVWLPLSRYFRLSVFLSFCLYLTLFFPILRFLCADVLPSLSQYFNLLFLYIFSVIWSSLSRCLWYISPLPLVPMCFLCTLCSDIFLCRFLPSLFRYFNSWCITFPLQPDTVLSFPIFTLFFPILCCLRQDFFLYVPKSYSLFVDILPSFSDILFSLFWDFTLSVRLQVKILPHRVK